MKDVRSWVEKKLSEAGYSTERLPSLRLHVERRRRPDTEVLCIGLNDGEVFDAEDVDGVLEQLPQTQYILVVPTRITHGAYERAEERQVGISGFGELLGALDEDDDISLHVDSQEQFERRRLLNNRHVKSLKRKGHHAYEIRRHRHRNLTIVTTNQYEFTVDEFYSLLESYRGVRPDLVVVTNPNCHGLSSESLAASRQAGVPVILFRDFLEDLGNRWP